jgi:hypothetical protein
MSVDTNSGLLEQLLAARAGANANAMTALAEHPNPAVRLLAALWEQRAAAEAEEEPAAEAAPLGEEDGEEPVMQQSPRAGAHLHARVQQLQAELERLQEVNDTVAEALGACHLCWGDDPACEICQGDGAPGCFVPPRDLFQRFVVPALGRMKETIRSAARRTSGADPAAPRTRTQDNGRSEP